MEVVPASVGAASRQWDEQHLDLEAAAGQVGDAGTSGFSSPVAGAASRFVSTWERHTRSLGEACEGQADGLRITINDYLETDRASFDEMVALLPFSTEER